MALLNGFYINCKGIVGSILSLPILLRLAIAILLLGTFLSFRILSANEKVKVSKAIESILRKEYLAANSYALAKSFSDLELLGIIKCTRLTELNDIKRVFYDTTGRSECRNFLPFGLRPTSSTVLSSISGLNYSLEFSHSVPWSKFLLEIVTYVVIFGVTFAFGITWEKQREISEIRQSALALEKEILESANRQVKHDIASPLSAIKMATQLLANIDPQIKSIILNAVDRTNAIFNELSEIHPLSSNMRREIVNISEATQEIVSESQVRWKFERHVELVDPNHPVFAVANYSSFKRVLSNLLNNANESYLDGNKTKIVLQITDQCERVIIEIIDRGRGMDHTTISKLGKKGFSVGKDSVMDSGSGLGVYSAKKALKEWGGTLDFRSSPGFGTSACISLLKSDKPA